MNCPKCSSEMEIVNISGIEIDRCTRCKGIWFDQQEESLLKKAKGTHTADTGHQAIGEYYNAIRDINCPRCNVSMTRTDTKRGRIPIKYETCGKCKGAFFDAGEFRDFAEPTIIEFVADLYHGFKKRLTGKT